MSGTTMSTPSSSDSGNMSPASMTMMSSPQRTAMQFIPNSPRPPSGTIWSFPAGMNKDGCYHSAAARSRDGPSLRAAVGTGLCGNGMWPACPTRPEKVEYDKSMEEKKSWLVRRVEGALKKGFERAYESVRVDPGHYLLTVRLAHNLPVETFRGMFSVPIETVDALAQETVRAGMKMAAVEGAGLGFFGLVTLVPDLSILAVITMRT